ncbi:DUF6602 domain-containing protein [Sorangium cellulosum]|uniref:DUF6602 domain-containing protein n=1 Tax=Sorangium cellulosum TaxID=56 RepID=UPI000B0633C9|nr:DUF6602 domain-containing protein [Sorangium cellulosum]
MQPGTAAARRGQGAPVGGDEDPPHTEFYDGWVEESAEHLNAELRKLRRLEILELGNELESTLRDTLKDFLPQRVGMCRGWVVDSTGRKQGDDIIIYDAARFRALRRLREDRGMDRKGRVPAEAVLAYIEVKHTLYVQETVPVKHRGQSLEKACSQVAALKSLRRDAVPLDMIAPRLVLPPGTIQRRPGFPAIRNPWYAAVWALNLRVDRHLEHDPAEAVRRRIAAIQQAGTRAEHLPDVIAADTVLMTPAISTAGALESRPFITPDTELVFTNGIEALGAAMKHLAWAIDDILLGEIPWRRMLHEQLRRAEDEHGNVRLELIDPAGDPRMSPRPRD